MRSLSKSSLGLFYSSVILFSIAANGLRLQAQQILAEKEKVAIDPTTAVPGWSRFAKVSLGLSSGSQKDVVGATDGFTSTQTAKIDAQLKWLKGSTDWRNSLLLNIGQTKTPVFPEYVKSSDVLNFESLYIWHLEDFPKVGPYAKLNIETHLLNGYDVKANEATYQKYDSKSGNAIGTATTTDKFKLSESLRPMTVKESVGMFYTPYKEDYLTVEVQLGAGARQTLAKSQFIVKDAAETPEIDVFSMKDQNELGSEGVLQLLGDFDNKKITYKLASNVFVPFQRSDETQLDKDKESWQKRSYEYSASISFKTYDWLSFDYLYKAVRNYSVSPKIQRTDNLVMNINYALVNDKPAESAK